MRIVDRYITISIIKIFLTTVLMFCFLYILIDLTTNLDEVIDRKISAQILLEYYSTFLPIIFVQTSPVACLIAILFTFGNLNSNNEIIALRSSGLSFWQIAKPALIFGLMVSTIMFYVNEQLVPQATSNAKRIKNENFMLKVDRDRKKGKRIKNLTFYGLNNRLYFIDTFDSTDYTLKGITIIGYDNEQNMREKVLALYGEWTGLAWKFKKVQISSFDETQYNSPTKVKIYAEKFMDIKETPEDFLKQRLNVSSMNIRQLYEYISRFSTSGAIKALRNLSVDLHTKIAYPFGNIVIVLVGLPIALLNRRRKTLTFTSFGIAVLIGFLYYVCNAVGLALGKGGMFPPIVAAWLAPLIFSSIAFSLIKYNY